MKTPRLSVGLPVYNGERFLAGAVESLLGQTYEDFELILSDNASTDATPDICRRYAREDRRIRYVRQHRNLGLVGNHVFLVNEARGELFKWAAHDDLYARDLFARCVELLDGSPEASLAHSMTAIIDDASRVVGVFERCVAVDLPSTPGRFRSMLCDGWEDHAYGVIRMAVMRKMTPRGTYHFADRTLNTELALHGPFRIVPEYLYFRRDQTGRPAKSVRQRCVGLDPARANRWRHPVARLYAEYIWGYVAGIRNAPLSARDRAECYAILATWLARRAAPVGRRALERAPLELGWESSSGPPPEIDVDAIVAGRRGRVA